MFKKFWDWISYPYKQYKRRKLAERRLKELQEQDPFIYK